MSSYVPDYAPLLLCIDPPMMLILRTVDSMRTPPFWLSNMCIPINCTFCCVVLIDVMSLLILTAASLHCAIDPVTVRCSQPPPIRRQIGRASRRERACQYV